MKTYLNDLRCNLVILRSSWASWKIVENLEVPRNHVTKHSGARPPTWKISATLWKLNLNVAKTWYQKVLGTTPGSIYICRERESFILVSFLYFSFIFFFLIIQVLFQVFLLLSNYYFLLGVVIKVCSVLCVGLWWQ